MIESNYLQLYLILIATMTLFNFIMVWLLIKEVERINAKGVQDE